MVFAAHATVRECHLTAGSGRVFDARTWLLRSMSRTPAARLPAVNQSEIGPLLQAELGPGEAVLWFGQPAQGVVLRASDAFVVPFTVLWCGFAIFWTVGASRASGVFGLFGLPFVCLGIYITVGRFFADAATRARTIYAVTNRRLIVMRTGRRRSCQSTDFRGLGSLGIKEQSKGRATITFGQGSAFPLGMTIPAGWPMASQMQGPRFDSIDDGQRVYELIRTASAPG